MIYLYWILGSFAWFSFLYLTIPTLVNWLFKNKPTYDETVKKIEGQRLFELKYSFYSICVFSIGSVLLAWFYLNNKINFNIENINYQIIALECLGLILWNDIHFYVMHYSMHKTPLKKFHALHHRLRYPSAYSSYALHPVEALLLGSVMPIALLFFSFHIYSLLFLTIWSLSINTLEHGNKKYMLSSLADHQLHHSQYHGNYAFFFSILDKIFKTKI